MGVIMDKELIDEINYEIQLLIKSGFYGDEEILEIIADEFIEEDISDDLISKLLLENKENLEDLEGDSDDFINLKSAFCDLTKENIISIHNAGYDIEEGIQDSFELFVHLRNNKYNPIGFCFYTFEDIEIIDDEKKLAEFLSKNYNIADFIKEFDSLQLSLQRLSFLFRDFL